MTAPLIQRLDRRADEARARISEIQVRIAELQAESITLENELNNLSATRRTLARLNGAEEPRRGTAPEEADHAAPISDAPGSVSQPPSEVLGPVARKVLIIMATSDRPVRIADIVTALGRTPSRGTNEGLRSTLKRLIDAGFVTRLERGLYGLARPADPQ